jgi:hypothetical protein
MSSYQAVIDEGGEVIKDPVHGKDRNCRSCFKCPAAGEDCQVPEGRLHVWWQETVRPGDGVAHGLLAQRSIARTCERHRKSLAQKVGHGFRRQECRTGCCQFQGKGQTVQVAANVSYCFSVVCVQEKLRISRVGSLRVKRDRRGHTDGLNGGCAGWWRC